jgi:hypothetical protein
MKRQRKQSARIKAQTKPNRRFQRFSRAAMIGIPPIVAVGSGIVSGHILNTYLKELKETSSKIDELNDLIEVTITRIEEKKPIDKANNAAFARLFQETGHRENCEHVQEAVKEWEGMKANPKQALYYSAQEELKQIQAIEDSFHLYVIGDSAIGLVVSFFLVRFAMRRIERQYLRRRERLHTQDILDKTLQMERKREEQRQRQIENSGTNWAKNGFGDKTPPLKPIDSSDIHLERIEGRKEMTKKLEKAIREVCGRRCSGEMALSLVSLFSDSKIDSLIDCPSKLAGFLINYKQRINEKLGRYGWSAEEILIEIECKGGQK